MADIEANLKTWTEIRKLNYGGIKRYVLSVGLELPKHVTKENCYKLIAKENKFAEEVEVEKEIIGASASTLEIKKATSPKSPKLDRNMSRQDSIDQSFFETGSKQVQREIKRFKGQINGLLQFGVGGVRGVQNRIFCMDHLAPEEFEQAILSCDVEALGEDNLILLAESLGDTSAIPPDQWNNACLLDYDPGEVVPDKFQRFFTFIQIPNARERILGLEMYHQLNLDLLRLHEFTHHVHSALTEIDADEELVEYLLGVLLLFRVKGRTLDVSKCRPIFEPTAGVGLLKTLMVNASEIITPGDLKMFERFDEIVEIDSRPQKLKKSLGWVISQAQKNEEEQIEEEEAEVEEDGPVRNTNLMGELKSFVHARKNVVNAASEAERSAFRKQLETMHEGGQPKSRKTEANRLNFTVSKHNVGRAKFNRNNFSSFVEAHHLAECGVLVENINTSLDRLEETNEGIADIWKQIEANYFEEKRAEYLRSLSDPEFVAISTFLEEVWDLFLPDPTWALIWSFREPHENRIDIRCSIEIILKFNDKNWEEK